MLRESKTTASGSRFCSLLNRYEDCDLQNKNIYYYHHAGIVRLFTGEYNLACG